jgi:hypothetical protein
MREGSSEPDLEQPAIRRGATRGFVRTRPGATRHQAGCDQRVRQNPTWSNPASGGVRPEGSSEGGSVGPDLERRRLFPKGIGVPRRVVAAKSRRTRPRRSREFDLSARPPTAAPSPGQDRGYPRDRWPCPVSPENLQSSSQDTGGDEDEDSSSYFPPPLSFP